MPKGKIILKEIQFDLNLMYERKVAVHNKTACRVTLPRHLKGKKVIVIVPEVD